MQKQIRHAAAKTNDLGSFTTVTSQTRNIFDELRALRKENFNLQLRLYCKNEAKLQHNKGHWENQKGESPVVISSLRQELKLKTYLLMRATSATAEYKERIAKNDVKVAELESHIAKLESTADDLTAAKTQIKILDSELRDRDETVFSCDAKIRELAVKNSNLIDRLSSYKNNLKTKNQIRNAGAKWNHRTIFSAVTGANRHDENIYLNHCKGKGKHQYIQDLCDAQEKKLNFAITTLRKELRLKTNLLMQAASTAAEHKECIARNEMKIAELQSHAGKLNSTNDELKEAKGTIEALEKELKKRDETVVSCESRIKELACKNSKLISRAHTYSNNLKTKELLITQRKLLDFNTAQKHNISRVLTDLNSVLGYHKNLLVHSKVSVKVQPQEGISEAMARHRWERNEHLVRSFTKENKNLKSNIKKLECSNYVLSNSRLNFLMEAILKTVLKSFLNPSVASRSNSKRPLLSSSLVTSVDNDLLVSSSGFQTNEGIWSALRSAFLRVRDRVSKAMI